MARSTASIAIALLLCLAGCGEPLEIPAGKGISRELAGARSRAIEGVFYDLSIGLTRNAAEISGTCTVTFTLKEKVTALPIDFEGGTYRMSVLDPETGETIPCDTLAGLKPERVHDHIVVPGERLRKGPNRLKIDFSAVPVGKGGTALTRFLDESDGCEYYYTLFVPADAHRLFPCFDQPDLKGRLRLTLTMPAGWEAVSNAPRESVDLVERRGSRWKTISFEETKPISTYLMAFAAGDFVRIQDAGAKVPGRREGEGNKPMSLYVRRSKEDKTDAAVLFRIHREALGWLEDYFKTPYPFGKFEFALVPGFPYGGMEHPGSVFYSERSTLFDQEPTDAQILGRAILIEHEVSHQWFGDLVTMKWFDDLWLKEGFATFVSYKVRDAVDPAALAWLRFHQRVKPRAYGVDATKGTTPVYQELLNLDDAKSAYGAIVYNKAPAVLRQLEFLLGEETFRKGIRLCLKRYAFGNAGWRDVIGCFEEASGRGLDGWAKAWLLTPGMPVVVPEWETGPDGKVARFEIVQRPLRGEGVTWPMSLEVALSRAGARNDTLSVEVSQARTPVPALKGSDAPGYVFLNHGDYAYGRFLLDAKSLQEVKAGISEIGDAFLKGLLLSVLWDMVREAEFSPADFVDIALVELERETDPVSFEMLLGRVGTAIEYYLSEKGANEAAPRLESLLLSRMESGRTPAPMRLASFRSFVGLARTCGGIAWLEKVLDGEIFLWDIPLSPRDRWAMVRRLAETGAESAGRFFAQEKERGGVDARRCAFAARAAFDDREVKDEYFNAYLSETDWPESWLEESLSAFNALEQSSATLPYLRQALDSLEWQKAHRKIFFMPRWIAAFLNGHRSREALEIVEAFLRERQDLPGDVRLKVLQSIDFLERTIRIREKYGE